jgi:DNA-binding FadR family transcriptional regulator
MSSCRASPRPTRHGSRQDAEELLEPDLAFHRRIAEATGNDLLAYIGNMLSLALRESIKLSSQLPNTHALSLPRHKAILTALLNRDPLGARQATLVQLEETGDDISHHDSRHGPAAPRHLAHQAAGA